MKSCTQGVFLVLFLVTTCSATASSEDNYNTAPTKHIHGVAHSLKTENAHSGGAIKASSSRGNEKIAKKNRIAQTSRTKSHYGGLKVRHKRKRGFNLKVFFPLKRRMVPITLVRWNAMSHRKRIMTEHRLFRLMYRVRKYRCGGSKKSKNCRVCQKNMLRIYSFLKLAACERLKKHALRQLKAAQRVMHYLKAKHSKKDALRMEDKYTQVIGNKWNKYLDERNRCRAYKKRVLGHK